MTAGRNRDGIGPLARVLVILALSLLGILLVAGRASALQVSHHTFSSSFDGTGTTKGPFGSAVYSVGVDEVTGDVYVLSIGENEHLVVDKFDAAGSPLPFSAPELGGASSLFLTETRAVGDPTPNLVVDNSDGATQGRFYVSDGTHAAFYAFEASGKSVSGSPFALPQAPVGIAVSANSGEIWALFGSTQNTAPTFVKKYSSAGVDSGTEFKVDNEVARFPNQFTIDSSDNLFIRGFGKSHPGVGADQGFFKFDPAGNLEEFIGGGFPSAIANDLVSNDLYLLRYAGGSQVGELSGEGTEIDAFKAPMLENPSQVNVNGTNGTVYVSDRSNGGQVLIFTAGPEVTVAKPTTGAGSNFQATSVTLTGTVDPAGVSTTECRFEWGSEASITEYEHTTPCDQGQAIGGNGDQPVSATISGLNQAALYHFRLVAANGNGFTAGRDATFVPSALPALSGVGAADVHSDVAGLHATVNPGGAETKYRFEYGPGDCAVSACTATPEVDVGATLEDQSAAVALAALTPGAVYHYRIVAVNQSGTSVSPDKTIQTFPLAAGGTDLCGNAHVRQQTSAAQLLDCRAYELVSAADTSGYDVESDLVANQRPYGGYPQASSPSRVLYAVHGGGIPGTNHPTNRGPDPYVASRGEDGWSTEYVGVPADNPYSLEPFSSVPSGASSTLGAFAFGGPEGCSPCFAGQYTGIPVRLSGGALVQGMAGSLDPGPTAAAEGFIGRDLSADGHHLVFGSKAQFESDANNDGDLSIYDRDLIAGQTHVVSKTPAGATMTGAGIAELDLSADGSHIVIGQRVSTDPKGNVYYHLYMTVADAGHSIDLAPGSTSGVLYDGMSADGSKVFFTTTDRLSAEDSDNSADIYEDEIGPGASTVEPALVSTGAGGPSNSDSCAPAGEWNVASGGPDCSALAIAGGGGVSSDGGTIYFLSPELLDGPGNGMADQPNLYVSRDGGAAKFVATIENGDPEVVDAVGAAATRDQGDFQVTPDGAYAAFPTSRAIKASFDNAGHAEIYRYGSQGNSPGLDCVSCDPTNVSPVGDAEMASAGLSLANDGRVFFTTPDPLVSRDSDDALDAYEWEEGTIELISTGVSRFNSSLLSASADGTDAYFFTRDSLAPQDQNGPTMKIYDARVGGGFEFVPEEVPCKASDECHGPGTVAAASPEINSVNGASANVVTEAKEQQKKKHHKRKHGHHKKKHHKKHRKGSGK